MREVLPHVTAEGSFYFWWELPEGLTPERLLEHRVAVAPGEGFGSRGEGWTRLSLVVTDEVLETGLERLGRAIGEVPRGVGNLLDRESGPVGALWHRDSVVTSGL